jgi:hypothetical protein
MSFSVYCVCGTPKGTDEILGVCDLVPVKLTDVLAA